MRPYVYRTHDGGSSWELIVSGLHPMGPVNVVREDPKQPGLLFAGTERTVYFSVDDGASWNELRHNLPPSSMRDLVIHEDDLVVGTHGRSIWVLDNIAPLRELAGLAADRIHLFGPPAATRVRWNMFTDTPLPPEEPAGQNPPDGAILDYHLPRGVEEVSLEILDAAGELVRRYSSSDPVESLDPDTLPHPTYWIRTPQELGTSAGHHRFVWDLRYPPPPGAKRQLSIAAVHGMTPSQPSGPFVPPGRYTVRLTAAGQLAEQSLDVRLDPRVSLDPEGLELQTDLSMRCYQAYQRLQRIREEIDADLESATGLRRQTIETLRGEGMPEEPDTLYGSIYASRVDDETIVGLQEKLLFMLSLLQSADARPTTQARAAVEALERTVAGVANRWASVQ